MSFSVDHIISIIDNNRPKPRSCIKYPCGICSKSVKKNQKAIQCDSCETDADPWFCLVCSLKYNLNNVPFTRCSNSDLININNSNSMRFLESLPNVEIVTETCKFSMLSSNDASIEIPLKSCSKYYSANDFQLLNISNNFNIFHSNINGVESKLDNLNEFLSGSSSKIDVIALIETSEKEDTGFLTNVEIEHFQMFHTGSKSNKGGTAIYANKNFDSIERTDLNINSMEYENTWIEIKNKRSKNIIIASIYRHLHYNFKEFFNYL